MKELMWKKDVEKTALERIVEELYKLSIFLLPQDGEEKVSSLYLKANKSTWRFWIYVLWCWRHSLVCDAFLRKWDWQKRRKVNSWKWVSYPLVAEGKKYRFSLGLDMDSIEWSHPRIVFRKFPIQEDVCGREGISIKS